MDSIRIKGFKCFVDTRFDLGKLTVLAGVNNAGKTSLLHTLGVLNQTLRETNCLDRIALNGQVIKLGRAKDVLNHMESKNAMLLEMAQGDNLVSLNYAVDDRNGFFLVLDRNLPAFPPEMFEKLRNLVYISADRLGPRDSHSLESSPLYGHTVGINGDNTIGFLVAHDELTVTEKLCKPGNRALREQLQAHMRDIFENFRLDLQPVQGSNIATLGFANDGGIGFVRPQNIGFGISHVLPIYVACLAAPANGLVMVENPESHLHPRAQSEIGIFLAKAASAGVQLILETHSDHLINGIRKAVKRGLLSPEDVVIHFFSGLDNNGHPQISSPRLGADGSLSMWPNNFCDQFDKDLAELTGWQS